VSASRRILIVDDDIAARLRVRDLLERDGGCDVVEAEDGFAALDSARETPPDLVLLDLMMPGMSGLEVCAALRRDARTREVPIIVISAADESDAMLAALDAGAEDFLRKPYCAPELRAKVRTITRLNRFGALQRERDRFRWLLDRSLEPLIIADARGAVTYANGRARELFGLADGVGEDVVSAIRRGFHCDPVDAWAAWRELRWPAGEKFTLYRPETPQAPAGWYDVELQVIENGETLLRFTNRSGWLRRELETFAFQHLIAHKIRTPLNGLAPIFSYIATMQPAERDPEAHALLQLARDSAQRLQDTLCGVLRYHAAVFAPTTDSGQSLERASLVDILTNAADATGLLGRVLVTGRTAEFSHPELLEIVFTELFDNYAKYSRASVDGLTVDCQPHAEGGWDLRISAPVAHLGPEKMGQLGQPFRQPERLFTGDVAGVGLGISSVRHLLRWRGGDLRLEANSETGVLESRMYLPATFLA
jgi:two-component system cell cycle response regulator